MSMTTFMIWQMIGIFCAYFGVTLILPLVVFRRLLKGRTITNQILFSFLIGNFYIITMVQILQLLKISHTVTLILATVVPAYVVWVKLNKVPVGEKLETFGTNVKRVTEKYLGYKTAGVRVGKFLKRESRKCAKKIIHFFFENWIEVILQLGLFLVLLWVYGVGIIEQYGYSASDIPVHNYWINAMSDNNIFVAGVYPHGYHCMIYYLHEVFGIDTYIILSLFAFVQVICVHFALLYFLRLCCKAKYVPYIGAFMYAAGDFFYKDTYLRYGSTLPQEFGMIFILPAIYYGFEFFASRKQETENTKVYKYSLCGFALAFGLTLSVHFYNTIIVGLFCVAMAIGYFALFVRKEYFGKVIITCVISVFVAILPMGIAFATGTPLQGSLYWATNIIKGAEKEEVTNNINTPSQNIGSNNIESEKSDSINVQDIDKQIVIPDATDNIENIKEETKPGLIQRIKQKLNEVWSKTTGTMNIYLWDYKEGNYSLWFWMCCALLVILGFVYILMRRFCYGAMLITNGIYLGFMAILLTAELLGLPRLMDSGRTSIYLAYSVPIALVMPLDAIIGGIAGSEDRSRVKNIFSLVFLAIFAGLLIGSGHIRQRCVVGVFETNEAVTCLTNIIRQEDDFTWTICSANDELRMGEDHGYHYETITFLHELNSSDKQKVITIPTPRIYFFIEKVPLDYAHAYENSGQRISKRGAELAVPRASGITAYWGENRWITMSHMYYWAQEFQRMYPNEMKVYMETDNFVCYVLEQNTYSLLNLAIDYGYNTEEK